MPLCEVQGINTLPSLVLDFIGESPVIEKKISKSKQLCWPDNGLQLAAGDAEEGRGRTRSQLS